ncbi:MAG: Rne/Rng family ribonuclease [Desulfovibrio sp.]|nr:Rne/Rng family ribonuclease [Desulfovibrio sp.]
MTTDQSNATSATVSDERANAPATPAKKPHRRARKTPGAAAQTVTQDEDATPSAPEKISTGTPGAAGHRRRRAPSKKTAQKTRTAAAVPVDASPQTPDGGEQTPMAPARGPCAATQEGIDEGKPGRRANTRGSREKTEKTGGRRRMIVSVLPGEQVEVALVEDGIVQEYYLDMLHQCKIKGNIYKGLVQNIDTNLQAAFVNFGVGKNGFLQIDEIHPEYWQAHHEPAKGRKFPPIQKVLKVGQEVLVQVVKEPTGNKGAFLTTWLSLAGRFLVLTPGQEQTGVSRKVENEEERGRLRELMGDIDPGPELGVIVRTVSEGATKTTLKIDLQYLKRVWREIRKKGTEVTSPALVYQEPGLSERAVRDYLTDDVMEVWLDNEDTAERVRETASLLFPRKKNLIRLHADAGQPLWERFNLRRQLDQIYAREVILPSGGRLVFDQTEALMAVDVNSGKISGKANFEAMAHKTNLEAAEAVARQIRLRDVGGQVVIDFIEMREKKHIQEVEKTLRQAMKNDRARHDVGRISSFGLLELVRQRTGSSALAITMEPCPACGGTGQRRNLEWQALQALRDLRCLLRAKNGNICRFESSREVALYLLNHKRDSLRELEQEYGKCLEVTIRL